jgi:chemotaxis family two-component system response regulator Rcp1
MHWVKDTQRSRNPVMRELEILLVEDNRGDVVLLQQALQKADATHHLHVVEDGIEALEFLADCKSGAKPPPNLILLDLNLPRMTGAEVIQQIQRHPILQLIPLVVLTSSQHEKGVLSEWDPGRCLYLVKPATFQELVDLVRRILTFWESVPDPK